MNSDLRLVLSIVVVVAFAAGAAWILLGEEEERHEVVREIGDDRGFDEPAPDARRRKPVAAPTVEPSTTSPPEPENVAKRTQRPAVADVPEGGLPTVGVKLLSHDGTSPVVGATVALFRIERDGDGEAMSRVGTSARSFAMAWPGLHRSGRSRVLQTDVDGEALWDEVEPGTYRWVAVEGFQGRMDPTFDGQAHQIPRRTSTGDMATRDPDRICSGPFVVADGDHLRFESHSLATATVRGSVARFGAMKARVDLAVERERRPGFPEFEVDASWSEKDASEFELMAACDGRVVVRARWFDVESNRLSYAMTRIFEVRPGDVVEVGELTPSAGIPLTVRLSLEGSGVETAQLVGRRCELHSVALVQDRIPFDPLRVLEIVGVPDGEVSIVLRGVPKTLVNGEGTAVRIEKRSLGCVFPEQTSVEFRFEESPDRGELVLRFRDGDPGDGYKIRLFDVEKKRPANGKTGRLDDDRTMVMKRLRPGRYVALVRSVGVEPARARFLRINHTGGGRTALEFDMPIAVKVRGHVPKDHVGTVVGLGVEAASGFDYPLPVFHGRVKNDGTFEIESHPVGERRLVFFDRQGNTKRVVAIQEVNGEYVLDLR